MALIGKMEKEVEIKASADEFYEVFKGKAHGIPDISPNTIHGVEVHEGDWETNNSVKNWTLCAGGKVETFKERVILDEENKKVTMITLEGDLLEHYKDYIVTIQVFPKGEGCLVKWTWEYEKLNENVPDPTKYVDMVVELTKDIEAHLVKA